jgi:hypothetical protein
LLPHVWSLIGWQVPVESQQLAHVAEHAKMTSTLTSGPPASPPSVTSLPDPSSGNDVSTFASNDELTSSSRPVLLHAPSVTPTKASTISDSLLGERDSMRLV